MDNEVKRVANELFAEGKRIKKDCPDEVIRLFKYQIVPSGQGALWNQAFTTMVFAEADLRCMNAYMLWMLARITDDKIFTVDHLKHVMYDTVPLSAEFLGTCGLESITDNFNKVLGIMDRVKTKEEFKEIIEGFTSFVTYYHNWTQFYFPWYIGDMFPRHKEENVGEMAKMLGLIK